MAGLDRINDPRKIMVRVPNWIGDAVISLPALEALRARFPKAEIVLVAKPWVCEIYWHCAGGFRQLVYDPQGRHRGWRGLKALTREIASENFDLAVLFQNAFQAAWLTWRARVPARVGYARDGRAPLLTEAVEVPPPAAYGHQAHYYLQLLFRSRLIERPEPVRNLREPRLAVREAERAWARKRLEVLGLGGARLRVGIHPGASFGPAKRWPAERFAELADRLVSALDADVLIFGSASEVALAESVARAMKHTPTLVAGKTTLTQLIALMAECRVMVTNDSGPMHVAAAMGLPLVAVFGSTDERDTGPLSSRARIVKQPPACAPCGLRECPIDFRCMYDVSADRVFEQVEAALEPAGVQNELPA